MLNLARLDLIDVFVGTDLESSNVIVFLEMQRVGLTKDFEILENLANLVVKDSKKVIKKGIFLNSQICSKSSNE